jgi:hypothetical protein
MIKAAPQAAPRAGAGARPLPGAARPARAGPLALASPLISPADLARFGSIGLASGGISPSQPHPGNSMATITTVIAWGDVPTWLLVIATAIGGAALLWQLALQRRQLKEQQLIVAQQVRAERRDAYAQLLAALREWDHELGSIFDRFMQGGPPDFYSTEVEPKRRAAVELLAKVELVGSLTVAETAVKAVAAREDFLPREGPDIEDLPARWPDLGETERALLNAMRAELSADLADADGGHS